MPVTMSKKLVALGASAELANAFDAFAVEKALRKSGAEVVIDQLTSLPKNPSDRPMTLLGDKALDGRVPRMEGLALA